MRISAATFVLLLVVWCGRAPAAEAACQPQEVARLADLRIADVVAPANKAIALGATLTLKVCNLGKAVQAAGGADQDLGFDPKDFILFLDGRPLPNVKAVVDGETEQLTFHLSRDFQTPESKAAWIALLGGPTGFTRPVALGAGLLDGRQITPLEDAAVELVVLDRRWFVGAVLVVLVTLAAFLWLASRTNIIRDAGPPEPPPGHKRPFSLGRAQMAWWLFLVIGSYLFIFLVTGEHDTITEQVLILIGIATGTALGSAAIDTSKSNRAVEELARLKPEHSRLGETIADGEARLAEYTAQKKLLGQQDLDAHSRLNAEIGPLKVSLAEQRAQLALIDRQMAAAEARKHEPVSRSFLLDILSDKDGISFHRFQILVWTVTLGFLFGVEVYDNLGMPEFSATLLALMGISSGTYLGFKVPEQRT